MIKTGFLWGRHLWSLHGVMFTSLLLCSLAPSARYGCQQDPLEGWVRESCSQRLPHCCWWLLRAHLHNRGEQRTWEMVLPVLALSLMAITYNLFLFSCCLILKPFIVVTFCPSGVIKDLGLVLESQLSFPVCLPLPFPVTASPSAATQEKC